MKTQTIYIVHLSREGKSISSATFGPRSYKKALEFALQHEAKGYQYYIEHYTPFAGGQE